jgi:branched-chain amino acid transport system substrate-binding protein
MLPIAEEYERILIVEPAVADSLTGPESNRYVFKTSRNSSMDMQAQAIALQPDENLYVATLAEDYAFGRDGIAAFKAALEGTGATIVAEEYVPCRRPTTPRWPSACSTRCASMRAARSS